MEKKKKKTRSGARLLPALLVLMIGLGALAWIGYSRYTMFEGEILPRDTELLDLRGKDATEEKIAAAREALPNARVLYDVTIAGKTYSCDEKEIVTGDFTVGDIPLFSRFEGLESVDASECSDLEAIRALREALPGAEVVFNNTETDLPHPNTMLFKAFKDGKEIEQDGWITIFEIEIPPTEPDDKES